jgi:hypothetical protein
VLAVLIVESLRWANRDAVMGVKRLPLGATAQSDTPGFAKQSRVVT